jgi:hypothetical protein
MPHVGAAGAWRKWWGWVVVTGAAAEQTATPLKLSFAPLEYARKQTARKIRNVSIRSGGLRIYPLSSIRWRRGPGRGGALNQSLRIRRDKAVVFHLPYYSYTARATMQHVPDFRSTPSRFFRH